MNAEALKDTRRRIIKEVIGIEGNYVDDPLDSGGATKFGITHRVASQHGYGVKSLTEDQAYQIYESDYWHPLLLDNVLEITVKIAAEIFDTGVNMGPATAVKFLQRSLNSLNNGGTHFQDLNVDGGMGNKTLSALRSYIKRRGSRGEATLYNILNSMQSMYYIELTEKRPKDERFNQGWQANRVAMMPEHESPTPEYRWGGEETLGPAFDLETGELYQEPTPYQEERYHTPVSETPQNTAKPKTRMPWYLRFVTSKINWTTMASLAIGSGILGNVDLSPEQQSAVVSTVAAVGSAGVLLLRTFWNNPK